MHVLHTNLKSYVCVLTVFLRKKHDTVLLLFSKQNINEIYILLNFIKCAFSSYRTVKKNDRSIFMAFFFWCCIKEIALLV